MLSVLLALASVVCACVPMLGFVTLVWWLDRYDREPLWLMVVTFLWGAIGAVIPAVLLSTLFELSAHAALGSIGMDGPGAWFGPVILAPLIEEPCKAAILAAIIWSRHFDNMTDGFVYGATAGLGFAMTENLLYFVSVSGDASTWGFTVFVRTFYSALMHGAATSIVGAALGFARFRGCAVLLGSGAVGLSLAWAVHAAWNGLISVGVAADSGLPMLANFVLFPAEFLLVFGVFQLCLWQESTILRRELGEEAQLGRIPAEHATILASWIQRASKRWVPRGVNHDLYVQTATALAMRKRLVRELGSAAPGEYHDDIARLRRKIDLLLGPERS
jgi:protease PrsW